MYDQTTDYFINLGKDKNILIMKIYGLDPKNGVGRTSDATS
jgi:hypothetical protein